MSKNNIEMKKIILSVFIVVLSVSFFSCTVEEISENPMEIEACCGDGQEIPPPPPPPGN